MSIQLPAHQHREETTQNVKRHSLCFRATLSSHNGCRVKSHAYLQTAITVAAIECGASVNREETGLPRHDPTMAELRNICLDRRWRKDPVARKRLSVALCRAHQAMRQKQADSRFKRATGLGVPPRLKGPPTGPYRTNREPAGTHRHCSCSFREALHGSAALGNTREDMAALAMGCTAFPPTH